MAEDPIAAQTGPYQVELKEGQAYFFCRCGRSSKQPAGRERAVRKSSDLAGSL